ncbi:macrolide-specific efflux protein macA, partial [Yersinia pestis PY-92]
MPPLRDCLS